MTFQNEGVVFRVVGDLGAGRVGESSAFRRGKTSPISRFGPFVMGNRQVPGPVARGDGDSHDFGNHGIDRGGLEIDREFIVPFQLGEESVETVAADRRYLPRRYPRGATCTWSMKPVNSISLKKGSAFSVSMPGNARSGRFDADGDIRPDRRQFPGQEGEIAIFRDTGADGRFPDVLDPVEYRLDGSELLEQPRAPSSPRPAERRGCCRMNLP